MMRKAAFPVFALLVLSACTGSAPAPAINPAQLQQDIAMLKAVGCIVADASAAAAPIIAVTVDPAGQRVAAAVDQASGRICSAPSAVVAQ
jgi:hypothetical protein